MFPWSVVVRRPHFSFLVEIPPTPRSHFVMPSTVYRCITHLHMQQHPFASHSLSKKYRRSLLQMNACLSLQGCLYAGVCARERVGGELNHIYKPIIISRLISLCSEEINFLLCRYVCSAWTCVCVAEFPLRSVPFTFHL